MFTRSEKGTAREHIKQNDERYRNVKNKYYGYVYEYKTNRFET